MKFKLGSIFALTAFAAFILALVRVDGFACPFTIIVVVMVAAALLWGW